MASMSEVIESLNEPDWRYIVSVSGGKDSAALAFYMSKAYPQIPVEYVFCDTGCELPETYEYLERMGSVLGQDVVHLNPIDKLEIDTKSGRRNPFDTWLDEVYGGYLPNARGRWCTRVLKIEPFERYVGDTHAFSFIGIRADEDRDGYQSKKPPVLSQRPNIVPVYPFKDDGLGLVDIKRILEESGIGLPEYYKWRSRSGCYFCFYQQIGEWQRLKENHPDLFEKAKGYEKFVDGKSYTWADGRSLSEVEEMPKRYPLPLADENEGCAICHL